jgi:hypothetical protein
VILVDSSVWIDYFRGRPTRACTLLDALLGEEPLAVGDLMLAEVLQGFSVPRDFRQARQLMLSLDVIPIGSADIAVKAARNFIELRKRGITVRKTIDTLIATRCIEDGLALLHHDRDFEPFAAHLGLQVVA